MMGFTSFASKIQICSYTTQNDEFSSDHDDLNIIKFSKIS